MTEQHKKTLTRKIHKIADNLCSFQEVLNKLVAENILTLEESQELGAHPTRSQKGTQLVHLLVRKSDKAFWTFGEVLKNTNHTELASEIYQGYQGSII